MKTPTLNTHSRRGMALVIVLGMLVLVVILTVAFVSSVSLELQSSKKYATGSDARALADSAVSLVISQIQDATANPKLAWASQPGMIRTYDNQGNAVAAFKLYSSSQPRVTGAFHAIEQQSTEIPSDWASRPSIYADLNKPVTVADKEHYPIIPPQAVAKDASGGAALSGSAPIEGCFIDSSASAVQLSSNQTNSVPMPVQWIYMLRNGDIANVNASSSKISGATKENPIVGRIAFWTDDETCKVNINTASEGTFWDRPWTNIATPTGTFPNRTSTSYEFLLGFNMPAQNEFQRYPGHPAMTSLSAVFPPLQGETIPAYNERIYGIIPRVSDKDLNGFDAGSQSGTKNVNQTSKPIVPDAERLFASVDEFFFKVTTSNPREPNLKSPSDSFIEEDIEKTRFFITATSRSPDINLFNKPRISLWPLQINPDPISGLVTRTSKDKLLAFCSTIGNKPYYFQRYNTYTAQGQFPMPSSQSPLMDFYLSDTVSTPPPVPSRNQELYAYLQQMTERPIPGLGGSLFAKYPNSRDQILTQIFDFVRSNVNTFSTGELPRYYFTPFSPSGMVVGQSQIVPLVLPNGTKGFGRFSTITEAALIFYRKDKLAYKLLDSSNNPTGNAIEVPDVSTPISGRVMIYDNTPPPDPPLPINIGMVLILEPFNPSPGPPPWSGHVKYVIKGLDGLTVSGATIVTPFANPAINLVTGLDSSNNATPQTGLEQYLQYKSRTSGVFTVPKTLGTVDEEKNYPFFAHITLPPNTTTMNFSGGTISIEIYPGSASVLDETTLVQTINMAFPATTNTPVPSIPLLSNSYNPTTGITTLRGRNWFRDFDRRFDHLNNHPYQPIPSGHNGRFGIAEDWRNGGSQGVHGPLPLVGFAQIGGNFTGDIVRSAEARYGGFARGDLRLFAGLAKVPESLFEGHGLKDPPKGTPGGKVGLYNDASRLVHSLTIDGMAGSSDTTNQNGYYDGAGSSATADPRGKLIQGLTYSDPNRGNSARNRKVPVVPRGLDGAFMSDGVTLGDWDTGIGAQVDGPYINPADQATANTSAISTGLYYTTGGYISGSGVVESGASFSPNRQISSAVAFGSLPSVIDQTNPNNSQPWRTLLFGKHPAAGSAHPGFGMPASGPPYLTAPDHAFLDLFTMPIVEPYAISEPFSTAGKVNMNYQIVPFNYLTRATAIRAVLKSTNIMAIPPGDSLTYKLSNTNPDYRYTLNLDEKLGTLKGFEDRFAAGDIFRSASEICDISLVPQYRVNTTNPAPGAPTYATMEKWWSDYKLTGDNVREQPYGHIYPRLTTKSNTYTVHVQAQSLQKVPSTPPDEFIEGVDQIMGEYRGSFLIERYLDPNSDSLVKADGKTPTDELDPEGMVGPYKFRVLSSKQFAP